MAWADVRAQDAVTPVVGTIMILAITILGIGAIMLWGVPTLQAIQDRNALTAMEGEFLEIRTGTLDLTIDKASRLPTVVVQAGTLGLERGTRFVVTNNDFADAACDLRVTGWSTAPANQVTIDVGSGCADVSSLPKCTTSYTVQCIEIAGVTGSTFAPRDFANPVGPTWPATVTLLDTAGSEDMTQGDWVFRIRAAGGEPLAQAWLLSTNRLTWGLQSSASDVGAMVEAGAVFERNGPKVFLLEPPEIQENSAGAGDFVFWFYGYIGNDLTAVSARATVEVFIGQVGNTHLRVSDATTDRLRFDFQGDLAEAWCQSLLLRNNQLTGDPYDDVVPCSSAIPSVVYDPGSSFSYELFHARITARIQN